MTTTAILLSGGVDSLTAAHLLKQQGHAVVGIHFFTGFETPEATLDSASGSHADSLRAAAVIRAAALSEQLDIPVEIMDCRREFSTGVVDYFIHTYARGQTPNPCLVCNPAIKFGRAFDFARTLGAEKIATGHYARTEVDQEGGCRLLKGKDAAKDQSYFLARLTQDQLQRAVFPLGRMTKKETMHMAQASGLSPLSQAESQDICFIRKGRYAEFLERQPGFTWEPGPIKDATGNVIGRHRGLHRFTIGQRRGINCPAGEPYYVIRIDARDNSLIVGFKNETLSAACRVDSINWIQAKPPSARPIQTKLRYRHRAVASQLLPQGADRALVCFDQPQSAVTPGQGAVFYAGDEVLGGGIITN